MTSNENEDEISSTDSKAENDFLSQYYEISINEVKNKELPAKKSDDFKKINSKKLEPSGSKGPKNASDNFVVESSSFLSNKPPIPSEWGTEKTELPESERLKNLEILLQAEPNIPPSKKKKKIKKSKVKNNQPLKSSFLYDTSFDPEKEFQELNSRYPPASSETFEKSLKSKEVLIKKKNVDIEFFFDSNEELSDSSNGLLIPSLDSISENKVKIRNSKKEHNFFKNPIVHKSNPFLQIGEKKISKPYEPYLHASNLKEKPMVKKVSTFLDQHKPGTSKMDSYESQSSDTSEFEIEKKSSLKIEKTFSDFSLQGILTKTLAGNKIGHKSGKVKFSELVQTPVENSIKNLHLEGEENMNKINKNFSLNEIELEKSLKAFSERKDNEEDNGENNFDEEEDYFVFSWSNTDLGFTRLSLPSRASSVSNSIVDRLSVNYVLNSVVKRFIDVRQLAPVNYFKFKRRAGNFPKSKQQLKSQRTGVSYQ